MDNIIKKTYITELDRNILIYRSTVTNSSHEVDRITPQKKIRVNLQNDVIKNRITLELARGKDEEITRLTNNKIRNFGILSTKMYKRIGQKRIEIPYQLIDAFHVKALQNIEDYEKLNPINIRINSNQIINDLTKYKNYKYRFLIEDLLFSSSVANDTNVIFITCSGLNDAKKALINGKVNKTLEVINLFQIKNSSEVKGDSNWINAVFIDSEYPSITDHFSFAFVTKNLSDLLDFTFQLIDSKGELITFSST